MALYYSRDILDPFRASLTRMTIASSPSSSRFDSLREFPSLSLNPREVFILFDNYREATSDTTTMELVQQNGGPQWSLVA